MLKTLFLLVILSILTGCSVGSIGVHNPTEMNDSAIFFSAANNTLVKEAAPAVKSLDPQTTPSVSLDVINYLLPAENSRVRTELASHVVIHYMNNAANKPHDPYQIDDMYSLFESYGVSAHYVIDREGTIYQFVTEDRVAFHAGPGSLPLFPKYDDRLNDFSIGIELLAIGTKEEMRFNLNAEEYDEIDPDLIGYKEVQYESLNKLLDDIYDRHPAIRRSRLQIVGHDEYAPDRKGDPGSLFDWGKIGF